MLKTAIGIDIGGTNIRAALVGEDGTIREHVRVKSSSDPQAVQSLIEMLIGRLDVSDASAIGIGVPGRVDGRRVLSGGYVNLASIPVAERTEQRFGLPVAIENDCSMALIAEAAFGAARGKSNVVMLTIGTGIGGAILDAGQLLRGKGTAGQLGHTLVDRNGPACVCGRRGCVETMSSGTALGRHIAEAGLPAGTTAADLLAQRNAGDEVADGVLRRWAEPLQLAIDSLATTVDPDLFVLGGGLGGAALDALAAVPPVPSWYESRIVAASLGDDAGVIGAAVAALRATPRDVAGKRVVLINGVPASGKSGVAAALSKVTGWPVLSLDTIKNPFLGEIDGVDRPFNRKLGRASLKAMFAIVAEAPAGTTMILDAWFGFQPRAFALELIGSSGADHITEVWCSAPPAVIGERYAARASNRLPGHPGAEYVTELVELAGRAEPLRLGELVEVDTTAVFDADALAERLVPRLSTRR
jgi:glucokinase